MNLFKKDRISYSLIFSLILHVSFFAVAVRKLSPSAPSMANINSAPIIKNGSIRLDEIKFISKKQLQTIK